MQTRVRGDEMNRFQYVKYKRNKDADKPNETASVDDLRTKVKDGINIREALQDQADAVDRSRVYCDKTFRRQNANTK